MGDTQELNEFKACVVIYAVTYMIESFSEYVLDIAESVRPDGKIQTKRTEHLESVPNIPRDEETENIGNDSESNKDRSILDINKNHQGEEKGKENGSPHTPPRHDRIQSAHARKAAKNSENLKDVISENSECVSILLCSFLPLFSLSCLALALVDGAERYAHLTNQLSAVFSGKFGEFLSSFSVGKSLFPAERTAREVYTVNECRGMVDAVCGEKECES
jgi:hypothetical protein